MNIRQKDTITILNNILDSQEFKELFAVAAEANPWFTVENIELAVNSIKEQMLSQDNIERWLQSYNIDNLKNRMIGIVMAGNIPLVGFHDLLSVLMVGHNAIIKPSSKDKILITYIANALSQEGYNIATTEKIDRFSSIDALMLMGGADASEHFRELFADSIPILIRSDRHSVAIISGRESQEELERLTKDMFQYWGLGCRNITQLYLPTGYDFKQLPIFRTNHAIFNDNYIYHKALYSISGRRFIDKQGYLLVENIDTPPIGVAGYKFYSALSDINLEETKIQCIVTHLPIEFPRKVNFGQTQSPSLTDYPDSADILDFLLRI